MASARPRRTAIPWRRGDRPLGNPPVKLLGAGLVCWAPIGRTTRADCSRHLRRAAWPLATSTKLRRQGRVHRGGLRLGDCRPGRHHAGRGRPRTPEEQTRAGMASVVGQSAAIPPMGGCCSAPNWPTPCWCASVSNPDALFACSRAAMSKTHCGCGERPDQGRRAFRGRRVARRSAPGWR